MAIDQEIQRKVDAYRGNPQALQQRYAQNQQLVDLLALQKLKSEMDAAKRDVQMQMQQQPGTIKEQREQELLQRTKQEMMDQTAGVMRQKQAQQQKNLQRVAQGGLGALAPQRPPAPSPAQQVANQGQPVPRMAAGGIVAFNQGGQVTYQEWLRMTRSERERAGLPVSYLGAQNYFNRFGVGLGMNDPATGARIRREPTVGTGPTTEGALLGQAETARQALGYPTTGLARESELAAGRRLDSDMAQAGIAPLIEQGPIGSEDSGIVSIMGDPRVNIPPSSLPAAEEPSSEFADATAEIIDNLPDGTLPEIGVGSGAADAALERGLARADEYTNRQGVADRYAEMEARLAELDEDLYDPAQERRDQLTAFLIGTAGRGSTALAGGAAAAMNLRSNQRDARRQRLIDQFALAERGIGVDRDLAQVGMQLGREMYAQVSQNMRTTAQIAANRNIAELEATLERAQLEYDRLKDDRQFGLDEREVRVAELTAATSARNADMDTLSTVMEDLRSDQIDIFENLYNNSNIPSLQIALDGVDDPEEAAALQSQIDTLVEDLTIQTQQILNEMGWGGLQDWLVTNLRGTVGGADISPEDIARITGPGRE